MQVDYTVHQELTCSTVQNSTVQYSTVNYSTVQYIIVQDSTVKARAEYLNLAPDHGEDKGSAVDKAAG